MVWDIRVHRTDYRDVVDVLGDMRKKFTDLDPALAVFFEGERRLESGSRTALGRRVIHRQSFAMKPRQGGFGIKGVNVRWPSVGENMNHAPGFGGEMRSPR